MKFKVRAITECVIDTDWVPERLWPERDRRSKPNAEREGALLGEIIDEEGLDDLIEAICVSGTPGSEGMLAELRQKLDVDPIETASVESEPPSVELTDTERAILVRVLKEASEIYSNHSCNDFVLDNTEENWRFAQAVDAWLDDGDTVPRYVGKPIYLMDWIVMDYLAARVGGEASSVDRGRTSSPGSAQNVPRSTESRTYSGEDMVGDPGPWEATAAEQPVEQYDIEILDQGYEPGTYAGWTVQFQVKDLPRLSYQKGDPILEAFIPLERAEPDAKQLSSGDGASTLARTDDGASKLATAMMGGGQEGNILRGFAGAAVVEVAPVAVGNAPVLPPQERIAAACRKSIAAHLAAVAEEKRRLDVTEGSESVVGTRMKV